MNSETGKEHLILKSANKYDTHSSFFRAVPKLPYLASTMDVDIVAYFFVFHNTKEDQSKMQKLLRNFSIYIKTTPSCIRICHQLQRTCGKKIKPFIALQVFQHM